MFKVIAKTALKTLAIVIALIVLAFGIASLGFPSAMAGAFEKLGNYSFATGYASLSYSYSKDVADLARCAQDSILAGNDKATVRFGDKLISHEDFSSYCEKESERLGLDYFQFICGNTACAKYRTGNTDGALKTCETALSETEGFPEGNAYARLTVVVAEKNDADTAKLIKTALEGVASGGGTYDTVINILDKIINEGVSNE